MYEGKLQDAFCLVFHPSSFSVLNLCLSSFASSYIFSSFCLILLLPSFLPFFILYSLSFTLLYFPLLFPFYSFPFLLFSLSIFLFFFTSFFLHIFSDNAQETELKTSYFLQVFLGSWVLGYHRNLHVLAFVKLAQSVGVPTKSIIPNQE